MITKQPQSKIDPDKQYTFSEIFELPGSTRDILAAFGYELRNDIIDLPRSPIDEIAVSQLQRRLYLHMERVGMDSETARREFLASHVLSGLLEYSDAHIDVEHSVTSERLRGNIDYLLRGHERIIVVEAKNDEMERGFRQLSVELIATAENLSMQELYGIVTTGEFWRFGFLNADTKTITRDSNNYVAPTGLADLLAVLLGLLESDA
ncbi:MAG: hypothetical protein AAF702_00935 [Chloroflexota bacterium]